MKKYRTIINMVKSWRVAVFLFLALGMALEIGSGFVFAEDGSKPDYRLQISPTQDNIGTVEPGGTYTGSFHVQNTGKKEYSYEVSIAPFSFKNSSYEQDFDTAGKYTVLTDWVTFQSDHGTVKPDGQNEVRYTIKVPKNSPSGLQSAAIMVTMINDDEMQASGVQTISRAAYPIYMNVGGDTERRGSVIENKIPRLIFNPPLITSSVVKNDGNIYTTATYEVEVYDVFGGRQVYTNVIEDNDGTKRPGAEVIFPETERYKEVEWENAPKIGIFRVKQIVKIFNEVSEKEKIVFICPIWLVLVFAAIIAIIVYRIINRIMKRREEEV